MATLMNEILTFRNIFKSVARLQNINQAELWLGVNQRSRASRQPPHGQPYRVAGKAVNELSGLGVKSRARGLCRIRNFHNGKHRRAGRRGGHVHAAAT